MRLGSPYQGYLYSYPHKSAYRPLSPRPSLVDLWAGERADALFLYVHLPFCARRCGYCNLFALAHPTTEVIDAYLRQVAVQADRVRRALDNTPGPVRFVQAAIGGGTPTYLGATQLTNLIDRVEAAMGVDLRTGPFSVETSPETATSDRLSVLVDRGATRISIGVQSFLDGEARAAGRVQQHTEVARALDAIRATGVQVLNVDLMYGIPGQTPQTWESSLRTALRWLPEELYLYPLYIRPGTGLARSRDLAADPRWDAQRLRLYEQAVALLVAAGYEQESMRMFRRRPDPAPVAQGAPTGPVANAVPAVGAVDHPGEDDGMIGLGCGARSYTSGLHYSMEYAVSARGVRAVLDDYLRRAPRDFDVADVGFALDDVERRLRWLLTLLLRVSGVARTSYSARFGTMVDDDFPMLAELAAAGLLTSDAAGLRLTPAGLARSDAIGPWLVSPAVRQAMRTFVLR